MRALVWFRSDLRTADNAALARACKRAGNASGGGVVAVFVLSPQEWREHAMAACRVDLILRTLRELSKSLHALHIPLLVIKAESTVAIPSQLLELARTHRCDELHFNTEYEVNEQARDRRVRGAFEAAGLHVFEYTDQTLVEPGDLRTGGGTYYTVYSPFKRAFFKLWHERGGFHPFPTIAAQAPTGITPSPIPSAVDGFESSIPADLWPAGEAAAMRRLKDFCQAQLHAYRNDRDFPALPATSKLSPHLAVGSISPRQCLALAIEANREQAGLRSPLEHGSAGAVHWISEVLWREFYIHVMAGYPRICKHRAFQPATDRLIWNQSEEHLKAWQEGRTGVPIVDAGMRQLRAEGWMHNRVRMITAMYLTKDLFLDWRAGEAWFSRHLVDHTLASNNGGWQWSASTGTDASPYFRIFNPASQSMKFDKSGDYIRRYLPELREVEGPAIHDPSQLPTLLLNRIEYPTKPIVDHRKAVARVQEAFARLKT